MIMVHLVNMNTRKYEVLTLPDIKQNMGHIFKILNDPFKWAKVIFEL